MPPKLVLAAESNNDGFNAPFLDELEQLGRRTAGVLARARRLPLLNGRDADVQHRRQYRLAHLRLRSGFPLGLVHAEREVSVPALSVRVHPASTPLLPLPRWTVTEDVTPGAVSDLAEIVGKEAKVTLYPGRPILIDQIGPPALIERNQQVKMSYADGPLSIMTEGRALDRGGVGETIRVMNLTSKQIVSGAVAADGSIKVTP